MTEGPDGPPAGDEVAATDADEHGPEQDGPGEDSEAPVEATDGPAEDTDGTAEDSPVPNQSGDGHADGGAPDAIPLDIAGHEARDRPGEDGDAGERPETGVAAAVAESSEDEQATTVPTGSAAGEDPDGEEPAEDEEEGSEEVEPIELLVQLAKDGEIDPWDVDVVQVTEEFLAALDDGDLRQSGRALFYASVLVRMKSDVLLEPDEPEEPDEQWAGPMEAPEDAPPAFDPIESLEAEMQRRIDRKHVRGTPETLDELVRELREAERGSWWKQSREYDTSNSPAGFARGAQTVDYHADDTRRRDGEPTAGEVTERTHAEDIEEVIDAVRSALAEHYEAGRPEVLFREVEDAGGSRVETFLAVLFLANRGEVRLQQDRLFGDLWLQDPTADLGAEGAVAD